jgi:hypothetical protein
MFHNDLDPKCRKANVNEKNNLTLSATGYLKPCCHYGTNTNWVNLKQWAKDKGLDVENLNVYKHNINDIYKSPLWTNILLGQVTGDLPQACWDHCKVGAPIEIGVKEYKNVI